MFVNPPATPRPEKSEKTSGFSTFWIHFWGLPHVFFYSLMWGGPEAFFCDFGPVFGLIFGFFQTRNTGFYGIFVFCRSLTAIFKTAETIVNTSVLCRPVAKNHANTTVFGRWFKKNTVNYGVFGHLTFKNLAICSGFCLPGHKNIVKKQHVWSVFFSCFCCCCCCCW